MIIRRVSGDSMRPAILPGHIVIAFKVRKQLRVGDIIIFSHGLEKIKRVEKVTPDGLYVLGDNLNESTDSRHFGLVKQDEVIGKVLKLKLF